ncbi:MAG: CehA/McbA family metallohydrolase [Pirellula sp.]
MFAIYFRDYCCRMLVPLTFVIVCLLSVGKGQERLLRVSVVDAESNSPLPARLYLTSTEGKPYYLSVTDPNGSAVKYDKQNWLNSMSIERHTTVSAHVAEVRLPPGKYQITAERGKVYRSTTQTLDVGDSDLDVNIPLVCWFDPESLGWYSGDTHIHRSVDELKNVVLAEDLNVAMPLSYWVTRSHTPPANGDKSIAGEIPADLVTVDDRHVIWPRNTEYEIFSVGAKRHTLGALFVLGHKQPLPLGVPNWQPVIQASRSPSVLFDMDKLDWPFAMLLPALAQNSLYELANNHMWRTEFAFEKWNTPAPAYMQPPFGTQSGGERAWIDYTHGMYHTLLNCGLRLPPSAGTANGVHPVPAGFGRVYVHLGREFSYEAWIDALQRGRSFVTTGPMLLAKADSHHPGHEFRFEGDEGTNHEVPIQVEVFSESPILYGELLVQGEPVSLLRFANKQMYSGVYRSVLDTKARLERSGWFAIRVWEERPSTHGAIGSHPRVRFAHTAPWYVNVNNRPVELRAEERRYLTLRMQNEIDRSIGILDDDAIQEYRHALAYYANLPVRNDQPQIQRTSRPLEENRDAWLNNMIVHHRFSADEIRSATGMTIEAANTEIAMRPSSIKADEVDAIKTVRIMPYPGGRHPRRGFLDGAVEPQRETKVSVFAPWQDSGYFVVDAPEAIFSNLGLTYLAHRHVRTIWEDQNVVLPKLEWRWEKNRLHGERRLPNGIRFESNVEAKTDWVQMEMSLTNGTDKRLTGLRSQVCVMLKGAQGFNTQSAGITKQRAPFIALRHENLPRWIVTAWEPCNRVWSNPPVPCIHSDPIFPDCEPNQTVHVRGGIWFFEGDNVDAFIDSIQKTGI